MNRIILNADEIRKRVQKRVNAIPEVVDDDAKVEVPLPRWHDTDRDGCNWDMGPCRGGTEYETEIREAIEHVREAVNLADK